MITLRKFTIQDIPFLQKRKQGMGLQEAEQLITDWNSGFFQGKYFKKGWKIAMSQVRTDNIPSLKLHKSLGFEIADESINKKGNRVCFLLKSLV